jgi:hypothetical protein
VVRTTQQATTVADEVLATDALATVGDATPGPG